MGKLVKLQLRNVFHLKSFYVCLALTLLMSPIASFIGELAISKNVSSQVLPQIIEFMSSEVGIISEIFIALFCCFDFNEGTTKNIIARGYTRAQLLFSKYIVTTIALFIMYSITSLVYFILFIKNGLGFDSSIISLFASNTIKIIAITVFFATISFILEKNGSAIIACIFIPIIIPLLLGYIDMTLKINISNYWLFNIANIFEENQIFTNFCLTTFYYLIYIVVIIAIGLKILNKKEIK